jgi:hypothetical protein
LVELLCMLLPLGLDLSAEGIFERLATLVVVWRALVGGNEWIYPLCEICQRSGIEVS